MKFKKMAALLLALVLLLALAPSAMAADATVEFKASEPDANGCFTVDMTVYNVTLCAFQFAVRFDQTKVVPVDSTGNATSDFDEFLKEKPAWLSTIGTGVDASTGFFKFSGYIMPGTNAGPINSKYEAVADGSGLTLFKFRFKVEKEGDPNFRIATKEEGEPYDVSFPQGVGMGNVSQREEIEGTVVFDLSALSGGLATTEGIVVASDKYTVDSLLQDCIVLKIGCHAVVVDSGVTALYAGEKSVTPYISGDRTFVPLRFISERLGAEVVMVGKKITITKDSTTIEMTVGDEFFMKNDVKFNMDVAAQFVDSTPGYVRTMVPVRFIAEAFGMSVGWDGKLGLVIVAPGDYKWTDSGSLEQQVNFKAQTLLSLYSNFV